MSDIVIYTKYLSGNQFGGPLKVSEFSVRNTGTQESPTNRMEVTFERDRPSLPSSSLLPLVESARMELDFDIAVPLARALLGVAEGYVAKSVTELP